jgi:endoglucanase
MKRFLQLLGFIILVSVTGLTKVESQTPANPRPFRDITAAQLVDEITLGICWYNALSLSIPPDKNNNPNPSVAQFDTLFLPATTSENFTALKNAGFDAIRIPVTWFKAVDANYNIRKDYIARVTEIVNYAISNDMYVIINTMHDDNNIFKFTNKEVETSLVIFEKIWKQIADNFKNYDEKLIFEAFNEPNTPGTQYQWTGGNAEERHNLNRHYQLFVDLVRASGGNNDKRILILTPHGAKSLKASLNGLTLPKDPATRKLIVSVHMYDPPNFCFPLDEMIWATATTWSSKNHQDKSLITTPIDLAYNTFVKKGVPVIIGECGVGNKNNTAYRAAWAEFYFSYAKSKGIPCFFFDNGHEHEHGHINRSNNTFYYPEIIRALLKGIGSSYVPSLPTSDTITFALLNPSNWGYSHTYRSHSFLNGRRIMKGDVYTLTYSFSSNVAMDSLQILLVDNNVQNNWAWNVLSDHIMLQRNIAANTVYNGTITITATGTATNSLASANSIQFGTDWDYRGIEPVLTFTKLEIKKIN